MPNWCMNTVTITGDADKVAAIEAAAKNDSLLEHLAPIGDWDYGTAVETWGTKWEIQGADVWIDDDGVMTINFDSAWSPPTEAYEKYIEKNPDMSIEASYYESGLCFIGWYKSSEEIDESFNIDFEDEDWRDGIPQDLIDDWGLDDEYETWKEWQDDRDDD
jgi:hypothetical protein